jgi:putative membrane protein
MVAGELSPTERKDVAQAIASARARTKAQFALVIVPDSDHYRFYPPIWAACAALVAAGLIAFAFPHLGLRAAFVIQAVLFAALTLALEWRPLRLLVVPPEAKRAAAHAFAEREFTNRVLAHPDRKGGVLFFVSLSEHYAEIIADRTLHQAAGQAAWDKIVADFTSAARQGQIAQGFIAGVNACGALLERHHPIEK